jgi:hypothetical protein
VVGLVGRYRSCSSTTLGDMGLSVLNLLTVLVVMMLFAATASRLDEAKAAAVANGVDQNSDEGK